MDITTAVTNYQETHRTAQAACEHFQKLLVARYGKKAGDMRYLREAWDTPELVAAAEAHALASNAQHEAWLKTL